jgi:glycosyltransferase involved in cell wall biosynthesis
MENSDSFDVVHAHSYHAFPALYAAQAKNRNKLIFTPYYHGAGHTFFRSLLHIPYKFLGKNIFRKADKIICVSNYEKSLVVNHFRIGEEKVAVIPNSVNLEEFKCLEMRRKDYRSILYVGRLEKYKGVQYSIKALPKLDHDIILEIVGKGRYKESLVKLARKLGVEDRVKFYQNLPRQKLLQTYVDADLFVMLSKLEAYGICVAEALAAGTPCIVANNSALRE